MLKAHVHFVGDDGGEGSFAEAWGAEEQDVVKRFAAGFGSFEGDGELLLGFGLADEFAEPAGAELEFEAVFFTGAGGGDESFGIGVWFGGHATGKSIKLRVAVACSSKFPDWRFGYADGW